ncbi:MAG: hypothetical protein ACE1Y0_00060 [Nitrosopumilaceae archaeon]
MANQVTVKLITTKGDWETTFQKSTRVKDVILALKVHFRLPKDSKFTLYKQTSPEVGFEPDRALINYSVKDGDVLVLKQV